MDRREDDIQTLLDQARATRSPDTILADAVLPAMRAVVERHSSGGLILPRVLESAEIAQRALRYLGAPTRGSVVVATLAGDVHHIGRALLVAILAACGYRVHDLGNQVPVEAIVDAAVRLWPDAIGLSALLVSTSKQMPTCVQQLDARGVHIPVLIGGAAINRTFGRRSGVLPDGRLYEPGVVYCRDVFEGLAALDALMDPSRRATFVASLRGEIEAEPAPPVVRPRPQDASHAPRRDVPVPRPPRWGARSVAADLPDVWASLDRNTLFRYHWGGYRASAEEYGALVREVFEPTLAALQAEADWLEPLIVSGYFRCAADGDALLVFDPDDDARIAARFEFPRQPDGERLCLADYFRPVAAGERDVVVLQAVTTGPGAGEYIERLLRSGDYARMLYVSGLAAATAEALAEYAHNLARRELGLAPARGLRFSWGYAACPDLAEQRKVLPLLDAEARVGLRLSQSDNLDPEHSTAAIILHHPEAKYFAVRVGAA